MHASASGVPSSATPTRGTRSFATFQPETTACVQAVRAADIGDTMVQAGKATADEARVPQALESETQTSKCHIIKLTNG